MFPHGYVSFLFYVLKFVNSYHWSRWNESKFIENFCTNYKLRLETFNGVKLELFTFFTFVIL